MVKIDRIIRIATSDDLRSWDTIASHPLQSVAWGEFRKHMGIDVVRLAVLKNGKFVQCWQLTFHKIPNTPWTIGYFPKGPAPTEHMLEELRKLAIQKRSIFIQLEPNVRQTSHFSRLTSHVLRPSHHPLFTKYTFVLDLTKPEDDLLKAMHPKTRYNIRLAQKHGVKVKEDNSHEAFQEYLRLTQETTNRQGFYAHNEKYHRTMWKTLKDTGIARLFIAIYKDEIVSAWIVFIWKDTVYYPYGASSREHREVMAPTLMLWEIARWGKLKGLKHFDLWGALGPEPDEKDPWYGFHRFKQGFSPKLVEFVGSYDLVIHPILYRLYTVADKLRWSILKLKTRL